MDEAIADLEEKGSIDATGDIYKDKNYLNILLIGTDERTENFSNNARGDSCMIMSIGKKDGSLKLTSLERGMGVLYLAENTRVSTIGLLMPSATAAQPL